MSLQAIPPRHPVPTRPTARSLLRSVHDRNPFYLLSALSMFVGYRIVIAAANAPAGDWRTLIRLIATLQAYEAVIIALALFLIARRGLRRDGWILLGIEALFLVDLTNLNAELYTATWKLGTAVSAACFVLAVLKIAVVCRVLRLKLTRGTAFVVAAQLALLFVLPGLFEALQSKAATVSALDIYAVWWGVGGLLVAGAAAVRRDSRNAGNAMAALPGRLYVLVPLVSLLVHLASENRVYWVHFQAANLAPVLLAAVAAVHRGGRPNPAQLTASLVLVALAVLVSSVPDEYRPDLTAHALGLTVTPFRVALLAAAATTAALAVWHHSWATAGLLVVCGSLALLGSSSAEILQRLTSAAEWAWDVAARLVPETAMEWGYAAIAGAFVLLGLGAWVSLRTTQSPASPQDVS